MHVSADALLARYQAVRQQTEGICRPLAIEDHVIQTMEDVSPPKWHLAHVTWFFEGVSSRPFMEGFEPFHPAYSYLFNSYYNTVGDRVARPSRGLCSRPTVHEVTQYRRSVDERMAALLTGLPEDRLAQAAPVVELGLHHEQQHQELLYTDIKHILATNPLQPAYHTQPPEVSAELMPLEFRSFDGGVHAIGHGGDGFCFDNEGPRHDVLVRDFELANRCVTNGEYLAFMQAGGYTDFRHWLSDAWATVQAQQWSAPLYWKQHDGEWRHFTLHGPQPLQPNAPVLHLSYYEADAYARWAQARLPTEQEWELAAQTLPAATGALQEDEALAPEVEPAFALLGNVWEWTASPYQAYPGFVPLQGALAEYNAKFMCNQMVLRGGSFATPRAHIRITYRNFWHPDRRFQFTGLRLAK